MTGLGLVTKGKICPVRIEIVGGGGGGGIIYRDREVKKKPTKQECEILYFPTVYTELIEILKEEEKKFFVIVSFIEAIG